MTKKKCYVFDTTLRDGSQAEGVSFSINDKIYIAELLDKIGIDYIECGWPGSNPKDTEFFNRIDKSKLKHSKITVFGSTRRAKNDVKDDPNIIRTIKSEAEVACIFGKSWDLHVKQALNIELEENLEIIYDSISYLKKYFQEVVFDLEHFFDGFNANQEYAKKVLLVAKEAKADYLVLCDTNGGMLPWQIEETIKKIDKDILKNFGIHVHNDSDLAVSNSISAIKLGAKMVQGTINGFGERCGNANLISIIANAQLKMGLNMLEEEKLDKLTEVSRSISEISNLGENRHQAYVGRSAFAHKGGIHVSAVIKNPNTYEHIDPSKVGNVRRVLVSELSGKSNLNYMIKNWKWPVEISEDNKVRILKKIKDLEYQGYAYEGAEASLELFILNECKILLKYFEILSYRVIDERLSLSLNPNSMATVKYMINKKEEITAAEGYGPVDSLAVALIKGLSQYYEQLSSLKLIDFKVRILDGSGGTSAGVRVLITFKNLNQAWSTIGVSYDIISASFIALIDGIIYYLYKNKVDPINKI